MELNIFEREHILNCGTQISNPFFKSAMSENLGDLNYLPSVDLINLYKVWGNGNIGILVTGNVMIDQRYLGEPGNVVLEEGQDLTLFKKWAGSVNKNQSKIFMQLNHPGKQIPNFLCKTPVAPSSIPLKLSGFNLPRALEEFEILEIIDRFATSAKMAKEANFDGVQIHGAHGYLVAQFLSPRHNQRKDKWGGDLKNRMRFLKEIYLKMRSGVGHKFPISLKLNSADFQKDGLTTTDSMIIINELNNLGIDLIEVSGGTYEAPAMMKGLRKSTQEREAYFLEFSMKVKKAIPNIKVVLTGGLRSREGMKKALEAKHTDFIGLARPLVIDPEFVKKLIGNEVSKSDTPSKITTGLKWLDKLTMIELTWYTRQLAMIGKKGHPKKNYSAIWAAIEVIWNTGVKAFQRKRA